LVAEPMYPGGLSSLLLIAAVLVISVGERRKPRPTFLALGVLIAAALMTKVNVGGLAAAALAFALYMSSEYATRSRGRVIAVIVFTAIPFLLMLRDLDQDWAQNYAILVGGA